MAGKRILKTVVIGCGRIGAFTVKKPGDELPQSYLPLNHCAAIRATRGVKLTAVCDIDIESAKKAGKLHRVKNIYTDFRRMILEQAPDIIAIATRTPGRVEIIDFAAKNGVKGMHIEKPLATSLGDAKRALNAIKRRGIAVSYGTVRRYMPVYRQAKELLKSGGFGKLNQIIIEHGRSQLMWTHPHSVDLVNYFTDSAEIDYVQSSFDFKKNNIRKNKIDMDPVLDFGLIKLRNGISGLITDESGHNVKLICGAGEIVILSSGKNLKTRSRGGKFKNIKIRKGVSGRMAAIAELRDFINSGRPTTMKTDHILIEQKVLMALGYSGIKSGRKTKLSEIKDGFTVSGRMGNLYP